eukprot:3341882-Rhodomonas_salina.1
MTERTKQRAALMETRPGRWRVKTGVDGVNAANGAGTISKPELWECVQVRAEVAVGRRGGRLVANVWDVAGGRGSVSGWVEA